MNITQLKQGSLNGLRRQTNECLDSAYNKGYEVGYNEGIAKQKDPNFVPLQRCPAKLEDCKAYKLGLDDASNLIAFVSKDFIQECFPNEYDWDLFDLNAKYGLAVVIKKFKKWQEEKKKA